MAGVFAPVVFFLRAFVFTVAFFKAGFFFASFFFGVPLFLASFFLTVLVIGFRFFPADPIGFVRFLLVLFLAIRAVYHRHSRIQTTLDLYNDTDLESMIEAGNRYVDGSYEAYHWA